MTDIKRKIKGFVGRFINDGQFPRDKGYYAFISEEEKFIPTEKLKRGPWPTIFLCYEVFDTNEFGIDICPYEKRYSMILIHNGKPVESSRREGRIYKSSAFGDNKLYEQDVSGMKEEAKKLSKMEALEKIPEIPEIAISKDIAY